MLNIFFEFTPTNNEEVLAKTLKIQTVPLPSCCEIDHCAILNPKSSCWLQSQLLPNAKHSLLSREWSFGEGGRKVWKTMKTPQGKTHESSWQHGSSSVDLFWRYTPLGRRSYSYILRPLYRAWLSGGSKQSANVHLVHETPRPQPRTSERRPRAPFQPWEPGWVTWRAPANGPAARGSFTDKGACRCPLAAAIGVRAGGDGLWRTASLHRFILCKLKGAIREVLSTRGKGTPAGSTTLESRPSLSPWVGSITVCFLFPSPPLPHQHYATVKAVREAIPVCGCGPGELPVAFLWSYQRQAPCPSGPSKKKKICLFS